MGSVSFPVQGVSLVVNILTCCVCVKVDIVHMHCVGLLFTMIIHFATAGYVSVHGLGSSTLRECWLVKRSKKLGI